MVRSRLGGSAALAAVEHAEARTCVCDRGVPMPALGVAVHAAAVGAVLGLGGV